GNGSGRRHRTPRPGAGPDRQPGHVHGRQNVLLTPALSPPEPQAKGGRSLPPEAQRRREVGGSRSQQEDPPRERGSPLVGTAPIPRRDFSAPWSGGTDE